MEESERAPGQSHSPSPKDQPEGGLADISALIKPVNDFFRDYLHDASRLTGHAESISFPTSTEQVSKVIRYLSERKMAVTVQGSRTGLTGAAVPMGGHIMSMVDMNRILGLRKNSEGEVFVHVEPGVTLETLNQAIAEGFPELTRADEESREVLRTTPGINALFWPPDPVETLATIGGIASNNAAGITAYKYGAAAGYIEGIRLVDGKGDDYWISRKGKSSHEHGDKLLDLISGEGMYGVITELALRLIPKPALRWGMVVFFGSPEQVEKFVDLCQASKAKKEFAPLAAVEFLDSTTLQIAEAARQNMSRLATLPAIPPGQNSAVYVEMHSDSEEETEILAESLMVCLDELGVNLGLVWAASDDKELARIKNLRLVVPELCNKLVDINRRKYPEITKLATDYTFDEPFSRALHEYQSDIRDTYLASAIFGHALENHLHVNLFPEDQIQLANARRLLVHWAERVHVYGGKVIGEHGVGKLKAEASMADVSGRTEEKVAGIKGVFDPENLFNPGNRKPVGEGKSSD